MDADFLLEKQKDLTAMSDGELLKLRAGASLCLHHCKAAPLDDQCNLLPALMVTVS